MNKDTYIDWAVTGAEALATMFEAVDRAEAPITAEMATRAEEALKRLQRCVQKFPDRVENR